MRVVGVRGLLLPLEPLLAQHQFLEVDLVAVEIGSVDAGELDLAADRDAARAAHPGAVDHDRVQRHHGLHPGGARGLDTGVHHRQRPDRDDQVRPVVVQDFLQRRGDERRLAVAAVVGAYDQVVAVAAEGLFPEHEVLVAKADDAGGPVASLLERAQLRIHRRHTEAAADQHHVPGPAHMLRQAERADEVDDAVAGLVVVTHFQRRLAERLDHQGDRALVAIVIGDGERNAFAALAQAQHDEMPGLGGARHVGRAHLPEKRGLRECFAADDLVHVAPSSPFRDDSRRPAQFTPKGTGDGSPPPEALAPRRAVCPLQAE